MLRTYVGTYFGLTGEDQQNLLETTPNQIKGNCVHYLATLWTTRGKSISFYGLI